MPPAPRGPATRGSLSDAAGVAWFREWSAARPVQYADLRKDPGALARGGWWAVVAEFEGPVHAWRFAEATRTHDPGRDAVDRVAPTPAGEKRGRWQGPPATEWESSLDRAGYCRAVERVREAIRQGEVYQANICRVLQAPLAGPAGAEPDARGLGAVLEAGNPAPYAGGLHIPPRPSGRSDPPAVWPGTWVVTASPELSLAVREGWVTSRPIKGTARTAGELTEKDRAENLMITDLVRNDLQRACLPGTVEVSELLAVEDHPGLVHLVSTVRGQLAATSTAEVWRSLIGAALPAGSVSGAPKSTALRLIGDLEPVPRGPYCGAIGWIDADSGDAELAVGIRTFWWRAGLLRFGTGAGITWGSDPAAEWAETELKAHHLIALASREIVGA